MTLRHSAPTNFFAALMIAALPVAAQQYQVVDTGQITCYSASDEIECPAEGQSFYGQDAQHTGNASSFTDNGDGTVTDSTLLHVYELTVEPAGVVQDMQPFAARAGQASLGWGFARVAVESGSGILSSASVIDSRTGDSTMVAMKN